METGDKQTELLTNWENLSVNDRQNTFFQIIGLSADQSVNRKAMAALNQYLAEDYYLVMSSKSKGLFDPKFEVIKKFVEEIRGKTKENTGQNKKARGVLNSARAQAGVMDLLERSGFKLGRTDLDLDLQGLDLVAVNEAGAFLIDVKARSWKTGILEVGEIDLQPDTIGSGLTIAIRSAPELFRAKAQIGFACLKIVVGVFSPSGDLFEPFSRKSGNELVERLEKIPKNMRQLR